MKAKLKRIIADFHQESLPAFRPRDLEVPLNLEKIIIVVGPRRAGKTFYLYQIMDRLGRSGVSRHEMLYLNFEDERLELEGDYDLIFDAFRELYPEQDLSRVYLFFDEIQELPHWEKFVRRVADTISRHIFLTGSNAKLLSREIATSLRGRGLTFEILPLSFSEFVRFHDLPAGKPVSSKDRARIGHAFETYCMWGGFPELVGMEKRFMLQTLQEYFHVMLYRDLVERYQVSDPTVLKFLLKRLIGSFTKEFSTNKLYNDLKSRGFSIGKETLYQMMEEIFAIYMLSRVEKYDPSVIKREMSNKKVYLYDNGFATAMHYAFAEDRGKLLENLVFRHIREQSEDIYFIRNSWECDFVAFVPGQDPQLIQVTERLDRDNLQREVKGLMAGRDFVGQGQGLVLVESVEPNLELPEWIQVMPIQEWLLEAK